MDRYTVNGDYTQTFLSAREIDETATSDQWLTNHLKYTHGYGITLSRVDKVTDLSLIHIYIPLQLSFDKPQALAPSAWGKLQAGNTVGFAAISAKYDATVVYDVDNSIGRLTSNSFTYTTPAAGQSSVCLLYTS